MRRFFEPAPSNKIYDIGAQRRQKRFDAERKPNTFSYISPSDMVSPPVKGTIDIMDPSMYDYPVRL